MAVNESIYPNTYNWSFSQGGTVVFKTPPAMQDIQTVSEDWNKNSWWEGSNVFATFRPTKHPNILGSTITTWHVNFKDNNIENGVDSITAEQGEKTNEINLRYFFSQTTSGNKQNGDYLLWNFENDMDPYAILKESKTVKNFWGAESRKGTSGYNPNFGETDYNYNGYLINEINRNEISIMISVSGVGTDGATDYLSDEEVKIDGEKKIESIFTDGYYEKNGKRYMCYYNIYVYYKYSKDQFIIWDGDTNLYDQNNRAIKTNSAWMNLSLLCERKINDKKYYYLYTPNTMNTSTPEIFNITVDNRTFPYDYWQWGTTMVIAGTDSYENNTTLFTANNYSFNIGSEIINSDPTIVYTNDYVYRKDTRNFSILGVRTPLNDVIAFVSCFLLPFTVSAEPHYGNPTFDTNNLFIGIRADDGYVEGEYKKYNYGVDTPETDLYPSGFTPADPETGGGGGDDNPVQPDDFGDIPLGWFPAQNSIGGFVKYYMLNSLAVASLGKSLWDGLAGYTPPAGDVMTKNMIDNFYLNYSPSLENFDLSLTLSNVIDYFTGIRYFPIPNLPQSTGNSVIPVTTVNVGTGSTPIDIVGSGFIGGQGFLISNRLVTLSGGSVSGSEIRQNLYNNFLDYEPNVSCSVYIPYCGSVSLQPSTVLDPSMTSLEIRYGLDLYTGSICAVLMKNGKASFPLAISEGVIGFDLPLTGNNFNTQAISTMLSTARFENNLTASLIGTTSQAIGQAFTDPLGSIGTSLGTGISTANKEINLALSYPQMMGTSPIAVGRTSSMAGMIQPTRAFIQFVKHSAEIPDNYGNIFGFNSNTYDTIGNQQGFFVCVNPRLDGIPCTQAERDEIYKLLTTGVYIS